MPQPSGQVLLDPAKPNHAVTSFWYCDGSTLWDAKAGATLTKTGTAGTAVEGGANVVLGNGSTYYALASALSLAGAYTLMFRARTTTAGSPASMVCGSRTNTANFVWLASSGTQMTVRAGNDSRALANSASNVMATYALSRSAGGTLSLYKNGGFVASGPQIQTLLINHILSGYTGTSYIHNGALEFLHVINGVALDAAGVASYAADPYQDLLAPVAYATAAANISRSISPAYATATATATVARSISAASDSITLTSPVPYQTRQRSILGNTATFTVSGTYTGSPASIQYRFNGGTWAALVASPAGGTFSTTVTLPTGQGTFEVRFADNTAVSASVAYVTVGDVFIVAGQSNHAGRSGQKVDPVFTNFVVPKLGRDFVWKPLTESTTQAGSFDEAASAAGSYIGALSTRLQSVGVPVAFCPVAQGSTSINDWARYDADPTNPYLLYGDARQADIAAGGNRAVLWLQGETDAANGMPQASYETRLNDLANDWASDTGGKLFVIQIVRWTSGIYGQIDAIRAAQASVASSNPNVAGVVDGNVWQSANNVHYSTATHINALADVVSAGMVTAFYSAYAGTTVTVARSVRGYASQAFGAARSVRAFAASTASIGRSVRNFVAAGRAMSREILAAGFATGGGTLARSVAGYVGASKAVAREILAISFAAAAKVLARSVLGSAAWPAGRCGDSHVAVVPWVRARYAVEPGDVLSTPLRLYRVALGGTAVLAIDYAIMYLASAADAPGRLLSVDADAGLAVVPTPAVGADVPSGVVALAVPAPAPGDYVVRATLGTVGGRTKPAALQVQALADVPIAKVFPLDQGAVEVFEIDFAAQYLPGHSDTATELAAFAASAGIAVQSEVPAGAPLPSGVVRFRVTAPAVAGDYSVTTALRTAAGRVEPVRVVLRVNPLEVAP